MFNSFLSNNKLISIRTSSKTFTFRELFIKSFSKSLLLKRILYNSEKYIPVLISNSSVFIENILALWILGKCPVCLNTRWTSEEIKEILRFYNFRNIIYGEEYKDLLEGLDIVKIEADIQTNGISDLPDFKIDAENNAIIIFTSGSSDKPKAVVHTFNSIFNSVFNSQEILELKPGDKILASLPFYHIGGFQIITRALLNGCEIIIPDNLSIASISDAIKNFKPTHLSLVSTQLKRLIDSNISPDKNIKSTLLGGGFIEDELIQSADELGWKPFRVYGSSETGSLITSANPKEIKNKPNTVGKPLKNCELKISEDGEILISSNSLFKGYLIKDFNIQKTFKDNFYPSSDIGFIDSDGYLFIESKRTDLIITGGENVNPFEVEKHILKIDGVKEVCVFPKSDSEWGHSIAAAIVATKAISNEYIIEFLRGKLAGFKIPRIFYFVDSLPKISIDKIDRKKVIELFQKNN